jgi:hypothetical protein
MISAMRIKMGRFYYYDKKTTVEEATQLSIFKLKKFGLLQGCAATTLTWTRRLSGHKSSIGIVVDTENLYAKVSYTITDQNGNKTDYNYKISLTTTPCNFSGKRYWFICPIAGCGCRTGILYLACGGKYFGCRHCYNLSYESRNETCLGRIGQLGYLMKIETKYENLYNSIKRWSWKGRPTRKVKKLDMIQKKLEKIPLTDINKLLSM